MKEVTDRSFSARVGQLFFSVMSHRMYDIGLYRFVSRKIWRCPTERLTDNYLENVSADHLEIGVGSGFFLEQTLCTDFLHRLVLVDLNQRCLLKSAVRLQSFAPEIRCHNILWPMEPHEPGFRSVGMNFVLHCIPGSFQTNQRIFHHVQSQLVNGGVFFGATLVKKPLKNGPLSWCFMKLLNAVGIFNNTRHTVGELKRALDACFREVEISLVGNAAVFRAVK